MWFINDFDGSMLRDYYKYFWGIDIEENKDGKSNKESNNNT